MEIIDLTKILYWETLDIDLTQMFYEKTLDFDEIKSRTRKCWILKINGQIY